jgi:transposase-like protein
LRRSEEGAQRPVVERLFGEERRRSKVIPHAFGERAVMKLMYVALLRASESWRGIRITEFECANSTCFAPN